jgi:hypothetical protein
MKLRLSLAKKYLIFITGLVTIALVAGGGMGLWFSYKETARQLMWLQREKAILAATRIGLYIKSIEQQMDWTAAPLATASNYDIEQRRYECPLLPIFR